MWAANLAALELHAPMALADDLDTPPAIVFDLDPGAPATISSAARSRSLAATCWPRSDLEGWCKTSGSKGLQLYVPLNTPCTHEDAADFALAVGQVLEQQHPRPGDDRDGQGERPGKVFVDWSQNTRHKTTIGVVLAARPTRADGVDAGQLGRGRGGAAGEARH